MATKKTTSTKKTKAPASSLHKALTDLRVLDQSELQTELNGARRELYILTMKQQLGELKQTHQLRAQRKYIAQVSTFLTTAI